jgi:hypothetical protein
MARSSFPFFPTRRYIAGFRIEAIFADEGQKARQETDQAAIVFGAGSRQAVLSVCKKRSAAIKPFLV